MLEMQQKGQKCIYNAELHQQQPAMPTATEMKIIKWSSSSQV